MRCKNGHIKAKGKECLRKGFDPFEKFEGFTPNPETMEEEIPDWL